jgi:hypothetical protein
VIEVEWIKVLNKHTLHAYTDLSDSEFVAWIKIMSLTAYLEAMPTREQMLQYVHYKTLESLQGKLQKHSTTLQYVLNKVLIDAQEVVNRKKHWKEKKQQYRTKQQNVLGDVLGDVSPQEKEKDKEIDTPIPPKGDLYAKDFLTFWDAYPRKVGKDAAWKKWKSRNGDRPFLDDLLLSLEKQKSSEQWIKDGGQFIPHPATWLNQGRWADEIETKQKGLW